MIFLQSIPRRVLFFIVLATLHHTAEIQEMSESQL